MTKPVAAAAVRESAEETGLQVEIRRLVAVIDSTLRFGDIRLPFVSYVLHVVETGGQLSADSTEVAGFREVWPGDLPRYCRAAAGHPWRTRLLGPLAGGGA